MPVDRWATPLPGSMRSSWARVTAKSAPVEHDRSVRKSSKCRDLERSTPQFLKLGQALSGIAGDFSESSLAVGARPYQPSGAQDTSNWRGFRRWPVGRARQPNRSRASAPRRTPSRGVGTPLARRQDRLCAHRSQSSKALSARQRRQSTRCSAPHHRNLLPR